MKSAFSFTAPICAGLLAAVLASSTTPRGEAPVHSAYIWQRVWTAELEQAASEAHDLVAGWHVLAAEFSENGGVVEPTPHWAALRGTARPPVPVVRIGGRLTDFERSGVAARLAVLARGWAAAAPDIAVIEIDYDCPTARLPAYAVFIGRLRAVLPEGWKIRVTALPTWIGSAGLPALLSAADSATLQVHAILAPQSGLFDPTLARGWIARFAAITAKPFAVALPAYGARVSWDRAGAIVAVESERANLEPGETSAEIAVAPAEVAALLHELSRRPPPHFDGVVWFRLPLDSDRRAWSRRTWAAVVTGRTLEPNIRPQTVAADGRPGREVVLRNLGTADALVPARLSLPPSCAYGDGAGGYEFVPEAAHPNLVRADRPVLRAGGRLRVGWVRCAINEGDIGLVP